MKKPSKPSTNDRFTNRGRSALTTVASERLLDVREAAEMLGTFATSGVRFPRRLIAERRIRFVRIGRLVRIPESALRELIDQNTVEPIRTARDRRAA